MRMNLLIDADVVLYLAVATADKETLEAAAERFKGIILDIEESHFIDDKDNVELYFSGSDNFRKVCYPTYKSNRKEKPSLISPLKTWCRYNLPGVVMCDGYEADDGLLIRAADLDEAGQAWSIATVDKDLKTHPGRFYNIRKQIHEVVTPTEAYTFMIQQFVMGDSVDGIPGLSGWGPKKTERLINDTLGLYDALCTAEDIWETNYGEGWETPYNETCNLAFIRRRTDDLQPLEFAGLTEPLFKQLLRVHI